MRDLGSGNSKGCTVSTVNPSRPRVRRPGLSWGGLLPHNWCSPATAGSRSKQSASALRPLDPVPGRYPGIPGPLSSLAITLSLGAIFNGCAVVVVINKGACVRSARACVSSSTTKLNTYQVVRSEPTANEARGSGGPMSIHGRGPLQETHDGSQHSTQGQTSLAPIGRTVNGKRAVKVQMRRQQMGHQFSQVPRAEIPRSQFSRSHGHKFTMDAGMLIPFFVDEVLPGDTFNLNVSMLARLTTPIVPVMDNIYLETFFFFVPNRLLWDNWQRFCGEQDNPEDSTDFLIPVTVLDPATQPVPPDPRSSAFFLYNLMGVPTFQVTSGQMTVANLHARAYNLIYNEWFRDQNLQTRAVVDKDDGPDDYRDYYMRRRGKRHDYFTSCLPWPQKDAGVSLPIGGMVPVTGTGINNAPEFGIMTVGGSANLVARAGTPPQPVETSLAGPGPLVWGADTALQVDVSPAAGTINSLRQAYQIQRLLERDARGGTRYTELVRSHFGVHSPDARLQRPEFLGGGRLMVAIHPIPQTSGSAPAAGGYSDTPQGNLAAYAQAAGRQGGFIKSFTEHGVLLGIVCARADLNYQQGLNRMWSRRTKFDFYWPAFSHLGEQVVFNKEIFLQADGVAANDQAFGYQERWAEYRYAPSRVSWTMQSQHPTPLDIWHLAQDFETLPTLGSTFIEENPPISRVLAVQNEPQFIVDCWFEIKAARPMPLYSVPGMSDHF